MSGQYLHRCTSLITYRYTLSKIFVQPEMLTARSANMKGNTSGVFNMSCYSTLKAESRLSYRHSSTCK